MYYYAYIDENNQVTWVGSMPTQTTADGYIQITEEQYNSGNLVGKYWNGSEFVDSLTHIYAVLNEEDVVIDIIVYEETLSGSTVVEISTEDWSLMGLWYDRNGDKTFKAQPIHILSEHSSDVIHYRNEDKWLSDKIDEIDDKIGTLTDLSTTAKTDVVSAINELFTSANNGKSAIAGAIVGKGGTANSNQTFAQLAAAITALPTGAQMASGTINNAYNTKTFSPGFIPKLIIMWVVEHSNQYVCGVGFYIGTDWHEVYGENQYYGNTYCVPDEPLQNGQVRVSMPGEDTIIDQVHWIALRW